MTFAQSLDKKRKKKKEKKKRLKEKDGETLDTTVTGFLRKERERTKEGTRGRERKSKEVTRV